MQNFNEQLEREAQRGDEFIYGAVLQDVAQVPIHERLDYLPAGVVQYNNLTDSSGCASRAPLNILETKLDYLYDHGMHPEIKKWCNDNGYRIDGKFALSDNFIEILSGTTANGNSLKNPVDAIRKHGVIPASMLWLENDMSWREYMDEKRITEKMRNIGQEFLNRLPIAYEKVVKERFIEALNDDMLSVALNAWNEPVDGVYHSDSTRFNHAVARLDNNIYIFDSYIPFQKLLAKDYPFFDWGYSISITNQIPFPPLGKQTVLLLDIQWLIDLFRNLGIYVGKRVGMIK